MPCEEVLVMTWKFERLVESSEKEKQFDGHMKDYESLIWIFPKLT